MERQFFGKTTERTPRANSSFPTTEKRETYRMAEEIMAILTLTPNVPITVEGIIHKAHSMGWCRPFEDYARISHTHPYGRVLTEMAEPTSPHFVSNLETIDYLKGARQFRLRTDVYRTPKGTWKKVKGVHLISSMPGM